MEKPWKNGAAPLLGALHFRGSLSLAVEWRAGRTPDPVVISLARAWPWIPRAMPAKADDRVTVRPDKSCAGSRSMIFYRRRYTMILDWIGLDLGLGVARFLPDTEWRGWILLLVSGLWVYISLLLLFYCFILLFIVGLLFVVYY